MGSVDELAGALAASAGNDADGVRFGSRLGGGFAGALLLVLPQPFPFSPLWNAAIRLACHLSCTQKNIYICIHMQIDLEPPLEEAIFLKLSL